MAKSRAELDRTSKSEKKFSETFEGHLREELDGRADVLPALRKWLVHVQA